MVRGVPGRTVTGETHGLTRRRRFAEQGNLGTGADSNQRERRSIVFSCRLSQVTVDRNVVPEEGKADAIRAMCAKGRG
jgi:hypothetical protein